MTKQDLQQIKEVLHSELQAELSIQLRSELEAQLPTLFKELFKSELETQLPALFKKLFRSELKAQLPALFKELFRSELEAQLPDIFRKLFHAELQTALPIQLGKFTEEIILPAVENIVEDKLKIALEPIKRDINELKLDVANIKADMANLKIDVGVLKTRYPDKAYLDDKLSDLRGDVLAGRKKDSARVDEHIKINYQRGNITKKDVEKLARLRAFAPLPIFRMET